MNVNDTNDPPEYEHAPPPAASMFESLRGVGYSLETAIADLIDNSIAARAANVWLEFYWDGPSSYISLLDDGHGMDRDTLRHAMRPGCNNPINPRAGSDLGRFGLGLKTASFSQARSLTVGSRIEGGLTHVRRWDFDHVALKDDWQLLIGPRPGSETRLAALDTLSSGTLVLWELLDRLVGSRPVSDRAAQDHFLRSIDRVREHLAMVFHRYLEGTRPDLRIFINGQSEEHRVQPWDPFMTDEGADRTPEEMIPTDEGRVFLQGVVLPHPDRMNRPELQEKGRGPEGWNAQQGFYVYRNRRMLVAGSWLGLGRPRRWAKDEAHKLARIRLDIPNTADPAWKIDIRKSTASPPAELRTRLTDLAEEVREMALRVFRHRGQYGRSRTQTPVIRVWNGREREDGMVYRIDRRHPQVKEVLERAGELNLSLEPLLQLIEQSVPVQKIWLDVAEKGGIAPAAPAQPPPEMLDMARAFLRRYMRDFHFTLDVARSRLLDSDPFSQYPEAIRTLDPDA